MKIAVTGATGHVGANLVRRLVEDGHEVHALVRDDRRPLDGLKVHEFAAQLQDASSLATAFAGVERVFHLAARISIAPGDEREVHATNVLGTRAVVEACLRAGVKRLVHFSSIHALEPQPADQRIDENRPLTTGRRTLPYDRSKADGEREVQAGLERGLDAITIIPTAILGPHDYRPSPMGRTLLDLALGRLPALVDGGFDWVDVRDVVDVAVRAADRAPKGERFLASGERRSIRELAEVVAQTTGRKAPRLVSPMWLARVGAPFATGLARVTGKSPRLTGAALHALRNHQWVSHDKATRELDYRPRPLAATVGDTMRWFKEAGALA